MTGKTFMNAVANGQTDILQLMLDILDETGSHYCVIEGLAVNAYAEQVISLDSVAALEDVLQGKIWAYSDVKRRKSKRQKDLSDILRLVETHPSLKDKLSPELLSGL